MCPRGRTKQGRRLAAVLLIISCASGAARGETDSFAVKQGAERRAAKQTTRPTTAPAPLEFHLTYDAKVAPGPYSGRIWLMGSTLARGEPRHGPNWLRPDPFLSAEVRDWRPGEPLRITGETDGFPGKVRDWPRGRLRVQAVMNLAGDERHAPGAPGNGYSRVASVRIGSEDGGPVALRINRVAPPLRIIDDPRLRWIETASPLLSAFYGREVRMRAAACLPQGWSTEGERYPAVYHVPGFGGTPREVILHRIRGPAREVEFVHVVLDPTCPLGHHAFADSSNNGPRGRALVEELIPRLEEDLHLIPQAHGRYLTGHSSGGWSVLWLQIQYPDFFGGAWAVAPDPVDFRDFCGIDLYAREANVYHDAQGRPRPLARQDGAVVVTMRQFVAMEEMLGPGGQMHSFEAVFSPAGPDGRPMPLFDRGSGAVDPAAARAWRAYDLARTLRVRWRDLGPKLRGKLHVHCGAQDTFYLDGAVRRLAVQLRGLGSDAEVYVAPGRDHGTIAFDPRVKGRFDEMAERFRAATSQPVAAD